MKLFIKLKLEENNIIVQKSWYVTQKTEKTVSECFD